jgi:putative membrane-bound dehydrogenase-like protein
MKITKNQVALKRLLSNQYKCVLFLMVIFLFTGCKSEESNENSDSVQTEEVSGDIDREFLLESTMIGYTGIGGLIDGVLNPVLQAERGEIVKITIINGELMPHDIALENLGIASDVIVDQGDSTSIVFEAAQDDTYYCTIPGHREAGMAGQFEVVDEIADEVLAEGVLPEKEGRSLNLNFETGTLDDWTVTGDAFEGQPIQGDPSPLHDEETNIANKGEYFLSSGGTEEYQKTGTLTSATFQVTHPYAAFWISGGAMQGTRAELVLADTEEIFFEITGNNHAALRPVVVDLQSQMGKEIFIRIVDEETGDSGIPYIAADRWAHINFDDFRFYEERPQFVNELHPDDIVTLPMRDIVGNQDGLSGEDAVLEMEVPDGFSVTLAASEPDVVRPIAMAIDERGRLWIAEGHTYPRRAGEGEGRDRILIFEDTSGDGALDNRTVFMEGLNLVSALEVGFGGVWVGAAPYLMFIPVDKETDQPAGEPEILLDGWGYQDTHETLNSLTWGPDGWLYGAHGIFTHSNVGKPGAAEEDRQRINAGIWRYHPVRDEFDVVAHGTSNPWGVAFNDVGHIFTTVCVIPHLFHVIPGARYHRQAGNHFNEHTYDDIKTIADHVHWVGDRGPHAGNFRSDEAGGGHAHAGAMFYMGNGHWGQDRDAIWMNNIHGYRVNTDHIKREGSGYTAVHGDDFLLTNDSWSQWLSYRIGPDGSVFAIDWYDKNQCHSPNPDVHEKTLGRIYKISHELDEWVQADLAEKTSPELVELQLHENEWYVQHSRKILQERGADSDVHRSLWQMFEEHPEVPRKLRALWALYVTDGLSAQDLQGLLRHSSEYIRGWSIQLLMESVNPPDTVLQQFAEMSRNDESALVRLHIASALQQIEPVRRWGVLEGLYSRSEDADDHNMPLMVWYAAEPMAELDSHRIMELALNTGLPDMVPYTARRIAEIGTEEALETLEYFHERADDPNHRHIIESEIEKLRNHE